MCGRMTKQNLNSVMPFKASWRPSQLVQKIRGNTVEKRDIEAHSWSQALVWPLKYIRQIVVIQQCLWLLNSCWNLIFLQLHFPDCIIFVCCYIFPLLVWCFLLFSEIPLQHCFWKVHFYSYYYSHLTKWHKGGRSTFCSNVTPTVFSQTLQVKGDHF